MLKQANLEWVGSEGEVDEGVANLYPLKFHLKYQISYNFPSWKSLNVFLHEKVFISRANLLLPPLPCGHSHPGNEDFSLEKSHSELYLSPRKFEISFGARKLSPFSRQPSSWFEKEGRHLGQEAVVYSFWIMREGFRKPNSRIYPLREYPPARVFHKRHFERK